PIFSMQKEIIFQNQFLEMLSNGTKEFSSAALNFFNVHHLNLQNAVFESCNITGCLFEDCDFRNAIFRNCTIYYTGFHTSLAE
ncbi:MAG: pentapeptide repeat-containing protein, partial [Candidatus Aenigmarchaeota archaeon]|nr:pentapeptide repeat-containing protein [Candidatus Aenigmarchaeota archaeon]MDI6722972.1 pentapeptide repeat-containing protein [Candidatus Aenigmarchaeota archaeon]